MEETNRKKQITLGTCMHPRSHRLLLLKQCDLWRHTAINMQLLLPLRPKFWKQQISRRQTKAQPMSTKNLKPTSRWTKRFKARYINQNTKDTIGTPTYRCLYLCGRSTIISEALGLQGFRNRPYFEKSITASEAKDKEKKGRQDIS